jgi:hypothetical protein
VLSSRNGGEQICFYLVKRAYCFWLITSFHIKFNGMLMFLKRKSSHEWVQRQFLTIKTQKIFLDINIIFKANFLITFFIGSATIDLVADADIFIEATNQRVGTINIAVAADITLQTTGLYFLSMNLHTEVLITASQKHTHFGNVLVWSSGQNFSPLVIC